MTNIYTPLTQDQVRGLFTHSPNHGATISFPKGLPNVVSVLTRAGARFDANFSTGLKRLIEMCSDFGVMLDADACTPVPAMELAPAREEEEALDQQEQAFDGNGPVETEITPDTTDARINRTRAEQGKEPVTTAEPRKPNPGKKVAVSKKQAKNLTDIPSGVTHIEHDPNLDPAA